uniref:Uncharacterized protein n=1 Tax=Pongo abelii TaxID=9601 RepID=A0A8I5TF45_PONAB
MEPCAPLLAEPLLERDETGGVGGPDAGPAVLYGLVGDGELAQVVADHLRLDLHLVEGLAVVDADHAAHHLRQDDHVPQVRLHHFRLLHGRRLLLGLAQALQQGVLLPPQAPVQSPPLARTVQGHQLLVGHVQQLVQVHATEVQLDSADPETGLKWTFLPIKPWTNGESEEGLRPGPRDMCEFCLPSIKSPSSDFPSPTNP